MIKSAICLSIAVQGIYSNKSQQNTNKSNKQSILESSTLRYRIPVYTRAWNICFPDSVLQSQNIG